MTKNNYIDSSNCNICMERKLKYVVSYEDMGFIARCLDVEVASEGDTREEAISNLKEALVLRFEGDGDCLARLPFYDYEFGELTIRA